MRALSSVAVLNTQHAEVSSVTIAAIHVTIPRLEVQKCLKTAM